MSGGEPALVPEDVIMVSDDQSSNWNNMTQEDFEVEHQESYGDDDDDYENDDAGSDEDTGYDSF